MKQKNTIFLFSILLFVNVFNTLRLLPKTTTKKSASISQNNGNKKSKLATQKIKILNANPLTKIDQFREILYSPKALRLVVFDGELQTNPLFFAQWESGEIGSSYNIWKAYEYLSKDEVIFEPLTIDFFKKIRKFFVNQEGNYDEEQEHKIEEDFLDQVEEVTIKNVRFGLPENITPPQKVSLLQHQIDLENKLGLPYSPFNVDSNFKIISSQEQLSKEQKEQIINKLLSEYEQDINQYDLSDEQFLDILAQLVMDLERIHPYLDFNCRTFAVFMLNKELLRRNLDISIMQNPNDFDYLTLSQSVQQIKIGQKQYQNLINHGVIHYVLGEYNKKTHVQKVYKDPNDLEVISAIPVYSDIHCLFCNYKDDVLDQYMENLDYNIITRILKDTKKVFDINTFKQVTKNNILKHHIYKSLLQLIEKMGKKGNELKSILDFHIESFFECKQGARKLIQVGSIKTRLKKEKKKFVIVHSEDDETSELVELENEFHQIQNSTKKKVIV